ncbi:MAG: amino acid ABC transporter ATP-binding protein [Clostridiales Family XIII bacterium]|jgi:polar amino acid transport system ATP-binding protein|nr:amino acid ABC transporter ATP-binding protein [Clostridiales Family XIII bacterium]
MEVLKITNLHKHFGKLHVLKGIDLSVARGEVVSVIGPSGSGKSTLLRCVNHLETAERGSIEISGAYLAKADGDGRSVYPKTAEIFKVVERVGMVFQNFNLFPHRSVLENLMEAPVYVKKVPKAEATEKALALLERVGLSDKKNNYPGQLSGGQQQRVAIARALATDPDLMLFDEPTSALDPELIGEVLRVIKDLAKEHITMLIVTHEMNFAAEISDRVAFMNEGQIIASGDPHSILKDPDNPRIQTFLRKITDRE